MISDRRWALLRRPYILGCLPLAEIELGSDRHRRQYSSRAREPYQALRCTGKFASLMHATLLLCKPATEFGRKHDTDLWRVKLMSATLVCLKHMRRTKITALQRCACWCDSSVMHYIHKFTWLAIISIFSRRCSSVDYVERLQKEQRSPKFVAGRPFLTIVLYSCLLYMPTLLGTTKLTDAMCCA